MQDAKFTYLAAIHFDELDPMQMLHNTRFAVHIERAVAAWYHSAGWRWHTRPEDNPDQFHVVREMRIEFLRPVVGPGAMRIDIWVEHIGNSSCVYGFSCTSEDGSVEHARGQRVIVKIDPSSHRTVAWTDRFRIHHDQLRNPLRDSA